MIGERNLLESVDRMLDRKRESKEHDSSPVEDCLVDYGEKIRDGMETIECMAAILDTGKEAPKNQLEGLFRETVFRYSGECVL